MTRLIPVSVYLIFSYAAPKSASGIGIVMVSFAIFWNEIFNCLPDFNAASTSGEIWRLVDLEFGTGRQIEPERQLNERDRRAGFG